MSNVHFIKYDFFFVVPPLTCVQPDTYPDRNIRHVPHFEGSHGAQNVQGHVGYFRGVTVAIGNRKARRHHVSIADGLHLQPDVTRTFSGAT